jgi:hypothetical protein
MSSTSSTPISEISDLGDRDRRLLERAQTQAHEYEQVNPRTMSAEDFATLTTDTADHLTPAQRDLMRRVLTPFEQRITETDEEEDPMLTPSSPSDYGINWLFPEGNPTVCSDWAEPILQVPPTNYDGANEYMLAAIGEDQQRFMEELTGGPEHDWLRPLRDIISPRPPTPRPPTPQDATVSESGDTNPELDVGPLTEVEMRECLAQYERELQTLHVIQGREDMQEFVEAVIRENPTIFVQDNLLSLARAQLDDDPRRELIRAILTAAALRSAPVTMSAPMSPEPLPVPPPVTPNESALPPTSESDEHEESSPAAATPSPTPSPAPSERTRYAREFFEALEEAPKGISRHADLTEPGWHVAPNAEMSMEIPAFHREWDRIPAPFL